MTDAVAEQPSDTVVLGRITGLFGVRGWVRVYSYTEPREAILDYDEWLLDRRGERHARRVKEGQRHGKSVIAHLDGVDDRDAAAALLGCDVVVARSALPELSEGRYYWSDLVGMQVVHRDGTELGTVAYVMETGANDVLVVDGDRERLVPFVVGETVLDVDLDKRVISVDWEWD